MSVLLNFLSFVCLVIFQDSYQPSIAKKNDILFRALPRVVIQIPQATEFRGIVKNSNSFSATGDC